MNLLCIAAGGLFTGTLVLNGGTLCNNGEMVPASLDLNSGSVSNYGSIQYAATLELEGNTALSNYGSIEIGGPFITHPGSWYREMNEQAYLISVPFNHMIDMSTLSAIEGIGSLDYQVQGLGVNETGSAQGFKSFNLTLPSSGTSTMALTLTKSGTSVSININYEIDAQGAISNVKLKTGAGDMNVQDISEHVHILGRKLVILPTLAILSFITPQYARLQRKPDGAFAFAKNNLLNFIYNEQYADKNNKLTYTIYNSRYTIIATSSGNANMLPVVFGDNRYSMNLASCIFPSGNYLLEVSNEKNEKLYLWFKHTLVLPYNCPPNSTQNNGGN